VKPASPRRVRRARKSSTAAPAASPAAAAGPAARPLRALDAAALQARFAAALAVGDGDAGAHCVHEAWLRGAWPSRIEAALESLWSRAAASIPDWLPMTYVPALPTLYEVAAGFAPQRRGRCRIYLVLLDYADRGPGEQGFYVGQTSIDPRLRFDQHKAGIRAAGSVLRRGVELLTGPVQHLGFLARADALRIEAGLAAALADCGLRVEGGH
jgi:hypothetical protein